VSRSLLHTLQQRRILDVGRPPASLASGRTRRTVIGDKINSLVKLTRTPELLVQGASMMVRRRLLAPLDYSRPDGHSHLFSRIDLKLTNSCNLRCKMCGQWGETGWHFNQPAPFLRDTVPVETYKQLVREVAPHRPWISIQGGEPFLYPDLVPLVAFMTANGLTVTVNTNGMMLEKSAQDLVAAGLDILFVSIDGPQAVHDEIRGVPGAFDRTIKGIRAVMDAKEQARRYKPYIMVSATTTPANAGSLDQIVETCEALGLDGITISLGWFQTEESCEHYEAFMRERLETVPHCHRGMLWSAQTIDTAALVETVRRIRSRKWRSPVVFLPDLAEGEIPVYYREHSNTFGHHRCLFPWIAVEVLPNGDVSTCVDYQDYIVGNIKTDSLIDIWNNDRYRKFRTELKEAGLLSICSRCCGLLGGGL
jgi:radical SAM protein with 4Fe4S-binding SPASM domain